jgi:hypothetical protein
MNLWSKGVVYSSKQPPKLNLGYVADVGFALKESGVPGHRMIV